MEHTSITCESITFVDHNKHKHTTQSIVIFVDEKGDIIGECKYIDKALVKKFAPKKFAECATFFNTKNDHVYKVIVVRSEKTLTNVKSKELGIAICKCIKEDDNINVIVNFIHNQEHVYYIALSIVLGSYDFVKYKTKSNEASNKQQNIEFVVKDDIFEKAINAQFQKEGNATAKGVFLAKNCINTAPNHLYPESYLHKIQESFSNIQNVKVSALDKDDMEKLGMGALLGVARGSSKLPKLVVIEYTGTTKNKKPVAYVGKGVTFDTGGISLKPPYNMHEMKYDMSGSAAVVGAMLTLAMRQAQVNAVGIVGLVENMPDGDAQRPGDVVTAINGKTIEILNTDAEGRLVLADAMWYAQEKFNPEIMVDLATLTGAITVALGHSYAGCFANDDKLLNNLNTSGKNVGEELWHMPLHKDYDEYMKSECADIANLSSKQVAGSNTAAQFLQHFTNNTPWAHLDIAGVSMEKSKQGFGVLLLNELTKAYE